MITVEEEIVRLRLLKLEELELLNTAVWKLIKEKRDQAAMMVAASLFPSVKVKFTHKGQVFTGVVGKVNPKKSSVRIDNPSPGSYHTWKVPNEWLEVI